MKTYTDAELAELATWAENEERQLAPVSEGRKAYGALRQGADWLIRWRVIEKQKMVEQSDGKAVPVTRTQ